MVEIPEDEVLYGGALMEAAAARIRELEAENARLRAELDTVKHQGGYTRSLLDDAEFQVARLRDEQNKLQWQVDFGAVVVERLNADLAAAFKAKGDWCDEHNRAESQCFKCDPSRAEKFAALYEAKIGEKPPQPTE